MFNSSEQTVRKLDEEVSVLKHCLRESKKRTLMKTEFLKFKTNA